MTVFHAALFTFGVFRERSEHPVNDDFHAYNDDVLRSAERSAGYVARSGYEDEPGPAPWGEQVFPDFYVERGDGWSPATLSLWEDLESIMAYAYYGLHGKAFSRGREWFVEPQWPAYAIWWEPQESRPDWTRAVALHKQLHEDGPSPRVFDLKQAFAPDGAPYRLDPERVRGLVAQNRERSDATA